MILKDFHERAHGALLQAALPFLLPALDGSPETSQRTRLAGAV